MQINYKNQTFTGLAKFQKQVDEKLIRGKAVSCPWRLYKMKQHGITQVIDLRNSSLIERPIEKFFCKLFGIKYINYKYPHRLNNIPEKSFFDRVNDTIRTNIGKTYIHCQYGKRRTGMCVAIYQKEFTTKSNHEIIEEMLEMGYKELRHEQSNRKKKKYIKIFMDFIKKYCPEELECMNKK